MCLLCMYIGMTKETLHFGEANTPFDTPEDISQEKIGKRDGYTSLQEN